MNGTNQSADTVPEGYHYAWQRDREWQVGSHFSKCRQPRCPEPPVAMLHRQFTSSSGERKTRPYAYCANHLYGRRIVGNVVMVRVLEEDSQDGK